MKSTQIYTDIFEICSQDIKYELIDFKIQEQRLDLAYLPEACFVHSPLSEKPPLHGFFNLNRDHGRSCITLHNNQFFSLKGTGWTTGLCPYLVSPKDPKLVFGLLGISEASREFRVSSVLQNAGILHGQVVGYGLISDKFISEIQYKDGTRVHPSILYTAMICPIRVKDLFWVSFDLRVRLLGQALNVQGASPEHLFHTFAEKLLKSIISLHSIGGVNDSLQYDNVTIAAEIVDLEWLYVPGIYLPNGSSDENLEERQEKEWIYYLEICQILAALLSIPSSMRDILNKLSFDIPHKAKWL